MKVRREAAVDWLSKIVYMLVLPGVVLADQRFLIVGLPADCGSLPVIKVSEDDVTVEVLVVAANMRLLRKARTRAE